MKTVRKVLLYFFITLLVLLVSAVTAVFVFKDTIIRNFIDHANANLNTPVRIGKFDVSLFEQFPHLSIVLSDVYVEDSHPGESPLIIAKKIAFQMNPIEAWNGTYNINGLKIEESETTLKVDKSGKTNYNILKESDKSGTTVQSLSFSLEEVDLQRTKVSYEDLVFDQYLVFTSTRLDASIKSVADIYDIEAKGELTTETLSIDDKTYAANKSFEIRSKLVYDDNKRFLKIEPSELKLKRSFFKVEGSYGWREKNVIDLKVKGEQSDIQSILSLFPENIYKKVEKYRSKGDVYFNGRLKGEVSRISSPSLSIDFGFNDATIYHPDYRSEVKGASMTGSFASSDISKMSLATLILKNIRGNLNGEEFTGNFVLSDFTDPNVICTFKGRIDAGALAEFFPVEDVKSVKGTVVADVSLDGRIGLLKNRATAQKVNTQGTVDLESVSMVVGKNQILVRDLSGNLQFSKNDLALSNVSGFLGNSDFLLNGFFKNAITYLLFDDQPVGIETDLAAQHIDLDQLFDIGYGSTKPKTNTGNSQETEYAFNISKNVYLNFNCDVKTMRYKRFLGRGIKGDLLVKNQVAVSRNLELQTMGGNLSLSGIVDATNNKAIDVMCTSHLSGIHLDSVFYVFQNFDQTFIEDKHLKGQVTANINLEMILDQNLRLVAESLIADINATIRRGELNNFEPMRKLNRYLDDEGLSKLRFADIQNDIHIEKKTIYIPQMHIRSNVTDIRISGTHTFDQLIDYHLVTPLRNRKRIDSAEAINAIEEDGAGQSKLFLKITGTAENYRITYDTDAVKKKIATDLKKEVQELKDAFKNKGSQQKKEQELQKDEYFDW